MVFPDNQFLYADELNEAFIYMKEKGMYKNIIFYIESCYSGSIFNELNADLNIYSITSASPKEQSYATYCYPDDYIKGREMHTCLSNEFTHNWLQDINRINNNIINIFYSSRQQFEIVKNKTKNSHVHEYGNLTVGELPLTLFQYSNESNDSFNYDSEDEVIEEEEEKEVIDDSDDEEEFDYDEIKKKIIEFDKNESKQNSKDNKNNTDINKDYISKKEKYNFINISNNQIFFYTK